MCCFSFRRINQQNRMIQPIAVLQGEKSAVKRRCGTGTWRGRDLRIGRTEYVHWAVRQHRSRRSLEPVVFFFVVFVATLCVQQQGSEYVLWTHSGTFHAPLLLSRLRRFVHLVYVTTGSGVDFNMSMNLPIKPQQSCIVSSISSIDSPLSSPITPPLFHSRLKTCTFCESFPPWPSFSSSRLTPRIPRTVYRYPFFYFLVFSLSFHFFVVGSAW